MDEKQLQKIKDAKKKVVDGSLVLWNARVDALAEAGYKEELINFIGSSVDDIAWTDICGCPGPDSPKCGCAIDDPLAFDSRINEMGQKINQISQELAVISKKLK